jgi:hypothetical protein
LGADALAMEPNRALAAQSRRQWHMIFIGGD